ncbi:MAG TPA: TlpA disulfide reductase family protein [Bryobacteraceae bacterium]|jgi:thiol-disulfide isomerase/thioredoxin|nr:TlpA disulfide reductase family protein [Bryobacteraceae bacterium]
MKRLFLCAAAFAGGFPLLAQNYGQPATPRVVAYVELAVKNNDLASAAAMVGQYRRLNGDTPEALEAFSWLARGELAAGLLDQAAKDAGEIKQICQTTLGTRSLDAEPHLPLALGAAYEVEAQVLAERHERTAAIQLLRTALRTWHGTSLEDRLQKNLNVLTLEGRPMPLLRETEWIGPKPAPLSTLHGKVLLLFFWAHWCADCKVELPVITQIAAELEPKGLALIAPTKRYGYTAEEEHAAPAAETAFIQKVYDRLYSQVPGIQAPLDAGNFERFGASTIPTLVVVDRRGIVRLYHPGIMDEKALRAVIEPLLVAPSSARASR